MINKYDITGKTFGYLTVICRDKTTIGERNSKWICKCKCGNTTIVTRSSLVAGRTSSCGCKVFESRNATHGMSKTRLYRIWANMRNRCRYDNLKYWENYGGKNVSVCKEWDEDFLTFYTWAMKNGYNEKMTIDRIDVDGNYCPENCRWVEPEKQQANKTTTIWVEYDGETKCLKTLCNEIGFPYKTAYRRYTRLKSRGEKITTDYLFAPIQKDKISKCYRR